MSSKFNDIFLKEKTVPAKQKKGYNVYTDKTNFTTVEAPTAAEAIEKSGVKDPFKVEPAGLVTKSIFVQAELTEIQKSQPETPPPAT